jgi:serine/threonine protein kinase
MTGPIPFGKYTLQEKLASGNIAEVYRAVTRTSDGQDLPVVVKKILPELSSDPDFLARFVDEARITSMLDHPNVIRVFEWGRQEDSLYIAMEYIEGTNLAAIMQAVVEQAVRFPPTTGIYIIAEALKGLIYAHALKDAYGNPLGLVHRDVSPPNIVVSSSGQVKLVDFGLAKVASKIQGTMPGVFHGKFGYMAPEVIRNQAIDARADLFSLGVALYEVLTGIKLEGTGTESQILGIVRAAQTRPPSSIHPDIPVELDQFFARVMAEDPRARPASAEAMLGELNGFLGRWDRKLDADGLSSFLLEVLSGRVGQKQEKVGFAFGEATSAWMARGDDPDELVRVPMAAESEPQPSLPSPSMPSPEGLLAEVPQAPAPAVAQEQMAGTSEVPTQVDEAPREPEFAPPKGRFAAGNTVMAIKEGGLGKGRQLKTLLIVLAVAAALVLVVVLIVKNLGSKDDIGKPKVVEPPPENLDKFAGAVQVRTQPEGALIFVDGDQVEPQGQPPRIMGLRSGDRLFKLILPGYLPWEGTIKLETDKPFVVEQKLEERRGNLVITSQPPKAKIFINGKPAGRTPKTFKNYSAAKTYKFVLKQKRYLLSRFTVGPADWPDDPAKDLTIEKKLERPKKKKKRRRR